MAKRKSGWGICGSFLVVVLVVWFVSRDDLPEIFGPHESCTLLLFTAYAIVRTVPSANRPNRRKKKTANTLKPSFLHALLNRQDPAKISKIKPEPLLGSSSVSKDSAEVSGAKTVELQNESPALKFGSSQKGAHALPVVPSED